MKCDFWQSIIVPSFVQRTLISEPFPSLIKGSRIQMKSGASSAQSDHRQFKGLTDCLVSSESTAWN